MKEEILFNFMKSLGGNIKKVIGHFKKEGAVSYDTEEEIVKIFKGANTPERKSMQRAMMKTRYGCGLLMSRLFSVLSAEDQDITLQEYKKIRVYNSSNADRVMGDMKMISGGSS